MLRGRRGRPQPACGCLTLRHQGGTQAPVDTDRGLSLVADMRPRNHPPDLLARSDRLAPERHRIGAQQQVQGDFGERVCAWWQARQRPRGCDHDLSSETRYVEAGLEQQHLVARPAGRSPALEDHAPPFLLERSDAVHREHQGFFGKSDGASPKPRAFPPLSPKSFQLAAANGLRTPTPPLEGIGPLTVEVDEANLIGVLRLAGFIAEDERDPEYAELERLLQRVIELWIAPA
jgi:hypothetical protein